MGSNPILSGLNSIKKSIDETGFEKRGIFAKITQKTANFVREFKRF